MIRRMGRGRVAAAGMVLALGVSLLGLAEPAGKAAAAESLGVDLASATGPATGVGEGFLYGVSQDATQPADQYLQPLHVNAFRGGGHVSRGWIGDNYTNGSGTQGDVNTVIAQARRLNQSPNHAQYQVILSDIFGADAGQPSSTVYPCTNGDCSNWVTFIDTVVGELRATGLKFAYDIWNEPELSIFWGPGVNTTQYFQMWDTAYRELRRIAPEATIVGPSFAFTPQRNPGEWQTWLAHVKSAGTVPDEITNHDEGDVDDPVTVSQAIDSDLSAAGLGRIPLSANEYQPADRQTAGVTAWYLARFAQSGYTNAMRGNWVCCLTPNLTGILAQAPSGWAPTGNWWAMRTYADLTGSLVSTSGQIGSTAISAAKDASRRRAVAIVGDANGYTGAASVTFGGLSSVPWLERNGSVHVAVYRIPDQSPLYAPQLVFDQTMNASDGSVTVPLTFQAAHDAFGIYLSWSQPQVLTVHAPDTLVAPGTYRIPVTIANDSGVTDHNVAVRLGVSAAAVPAASLPQVSCTGQAGPDCPPVPSLAPGATETATFSVTIPPDAPQATYRLTGTATAQLPDGQVTLQNAADTQVSYCCTLTLQRVPGSQVEVRATFANTNGDLTATGVGLSLTVPTGLVATPSGPATTDTVPPGGTASATWTISGPVSTPGAIQAAASYTVAGHSQTVISAPGYLSLATAFNNVGITDDTNTSPGNLDGGGASYSAQALAAAGLTPGATITHDGITFTWPDAQPGTADNAVAGGQIIDLSGAGTTLGVLGAGDYGTASGTGTITYTDGSTQQFNLTFSDWWANTAPPGGDIVATVPYINTQTGQLNQGGVSVYYVGIPLQQGKTVKSVTLPNLGLGVAAGETAMHIFAMTIG
jgi:hypothetical protein